MNECFFIQMQGFYYLLLSALSVSRFAVPFAVDYHHSRNCHQ